MILDDISLLTATREPFTSQIVLPLTLVTTLIVWPTAKKAAMASGGAVAFMVALSAVLFGFDHIAGALVRCVLALF